ncbi:MAG: hypothetical protein AAB066_04425 [Candidatus Margulisiibacteriota bacterium]
MINRSLKPTGSKRGRRRFWFEFKLQGTAEEALAQIQEKGYAQKYDSLSEVIPAKAGIQEPMLEKVMDPRLRVMALV